MPKQRIRLVLLGDSAVGKTVFCNMLKTKKYSPYVCQTIFTDTLSHTIENTEFILYDVPGSPKFNTQILPWIRSADAALVFEDVTSSTCETDWISLAKMTNPAIQLFQVRVKVEYAEKVECVNSREGIRLEDLALSQKPNLERVLRRIAAASI